MIHIVGPHDKYSVKNGLYVNTTSSATDWSRQLSPFLLGPVTTSDGLVFNNVENAWQYSKVYPDQVDTEGNPTEDYYTWRSVGQASTWAHRYPKGKGAIPLYTLYNGEEKLDYIQARKLVYMPLYKQAVVKTGAFKRLTSLYENGTDIVLFDYDGYNHKKINKTYDDVLNNPNRKMGHAFVLGMMLEGLY